MNIKSFQDPSQFAQEAAPLLMAQEAENNLPLGIMHRLQEDPAAAEDVSMLVLYDEEERPVYLTLRTPPHLWILPFRYIGNPAASLLFNRVFTNGGA